MVNKIKSCVFISGAGSNLRSIIKNSREYNFPIKIELIISDNVNAKGLMIAKKYNIPFKVFSFSSSKKFERKCLNELRKRKIKFICLAGFMRILSKDFINSFKNGIINIHPSLLPKFKGLNTHKRVLKNGEKYSGCTVHFVTPQLDSGKIIMRKRVSVSKDETEKSLKKKILMQEHRLYAKSIISIFR